MKLFVTVFIVFFFSIFCFSGTKNVHNDSLPVNGVESTPSYFFRDRYQFNDLANYLDNLNDFVTYQSETTGSFNTPDQFIFSVSGNSHKWNRYYLNGFRIDSRFFAGSAAFQPDLNYNSIKLNYYNSAVSFNTDTLIPNAVSLRYNAGGVGGISHSTQALINLFHLTASERIYQPIRYRSKMQGAGSLLLNYTLPVNSNLYSQQLKVDFGTRMLTDFDESGISDYYPEDFMKIQLSGQLPIQAFNFFDKTNYMLHISERQNLYNELYYSQSETAKHNGFSFSVYGSKHSSKLDYTSGITMATNKVMHQDPDFSRNVIDQDGEAFEPWFPDGTSTEFSHALNLNYKFTDWLTLNFDGYNSIINSNPIQQNFSNSIFARNVNLPFQSLYVYDWTANDFNSGLLDNTLGLKIQKQISQKIDFNASFDATFDAMLMADKSMLRPNWQAQVGVRFKPVNWFLLEFNLSRNRVAFNMDDIRYLSNDYLNADIYFWKDVNADQVYQETEKASYFTSTGGKYHSTNHGLKQPSYFVLDIPFYFTFGNHEISFLNSYKKYNNNWITVLENNVEQYGYFQTVGDNEIFIFNSGSRNYVMDYYPESYMKSETALNFLTNSPYYASSIIKYQYSNPKFLFSFSWCSYLMAGISSLGNGPLHNNIGVYSETTANPNNNYKLIGRLDQERAYVARIFASYKLNKHFNFALSAKFKDGQPFSNFDTFISTDANGNSQMAIWSKRTKGINPFNGDFGSREDAFFNIDVRATYSGKVLKHNFDIQLMCYNLYDFGTELNEYVFQPNSTGSRYPLSLNIPRGFMVTGTMYF